MPSGDMEYINIEHLNINVEEPIQNRYTKFLNEIINPYRFRCGGALVDIAFTENGEEIEHIIKNYFIRRNSMDNEENK